MIPSEEEYNRAKVVVSVYEDEQKRLYDIRVKSFEKDLKDYFENNLLDNYLSLREFELRKGSLGGGDIIPIKPRLEGYYDGTNDDEIEKLCEKHNVNFSFPYWCYPK